MRSKKRRKERKRADIEDTKLESLNVEQFNIIFVGVLKEKNVTDTEILQQAQKMLIENEMNGSLKV